METMLVWILISAGATIGLLATFLIASERELKKARTQIANLKEARPDATQSPPGSAESPEHESQLTALREQNRELRRELELLSGRLEASERKAAGLEAAASRLASAEAESRRREQTVGELQARVAQLSAELEQRQSRLHEAEMARQQSAAREEEHANEVAALRTRLEIAEARLRDFAAAEQRLADMESRASGFTEEKQKLEAALAEMRQRLGASEEKAREADAARTRLRQLEAAYGEALAEKQRVEAELERWRQRVSEDEDNRRRLEALQRQVDLLRARGQALGEDWRILENELSGIARLLESLPGQGVSSSPETMPGATAAGPAGALEEPPAGHGAEHLDRGRPAHGFRRYGAVGALGVLVVAAAVATVFFLTSGDDASPPMNAGQPEIARFPEEQPPASASLPGRVRDEKPPFSEPPKPLKNEPLRQTRSSRSAGGETRGSASPAPAAGTLYEVIRPTQVFSEPAENSQLIANIDPGTRINVVSSRNGWLEIRSRHGRPPGFVREQDAVRRRQN
ncbi:MAG TPA: hypothetical protein VNN77_17445 [candidate division Zixibacteria bacterium]|nr:hypothetical protein [candidate division Zixibacteria bacterium]